ncbi:MAG: flagellar biosynthesis protein FlhF [Candidatus Hydrogenedentes bacterium]|nr:flagellar biosynthesis protein FlhF [Candidatus Hydrogenedentota bacterium]
MSQRFEKIQGSTLEDAYKNMRERFGEDAVVMNTAQVSTGGFLGLFAKRAVEITAAVPQTAAGPRATSSAERKYREQATADPKKVEYFERLVRDAQRRMSAPQTPKAPAPQADPVAASAPAVPAAAKSSVLPFPGPAEGGGDSQAMRRELQEIREMMQVLYAENPGAGLPSEFAPHYRTLVHRGVSRKTAAALIGGAVRNADIETLKDARVFAERLSMELRRAVRVTGGIALNAGVCRVVALCGPTGVGKTTTLAKLAAYFAVRERARVALITMDTYRIAATEQLRVYANIIGLPLEIIHENADIRDALRTFADYDLVLVDTAGGSQFNLEQINELRQQLQALSPDEIHLVLSVNTPLEDLHNCVSNFGCCNPTALIFTKLDETRQFGAMLSLLVETGLPLGYLTHGQNVPDDIRIATPGAVTGLVLEGK